MHCGLIQVFRENYGFGPIFARFFDQDKPTQMALSPNPSDLSREQTLHMAKLAEQAERYDDMVKYMKRCESPSFLSRYC